MEHLKNFYMQIIPGVVAAFGFGDTEQTYEERQKGRDYAKIVGYGFAVGTKKWEIFGWWENCCVVNRPKHQDKVVHTYLESIPGIERQDEVFRIKEGFGLTLDIIKDMIHKKFFSDTPTQKSTLELRKHQKEFVAKAHADYLEFLLFAKCRAGKSIMTLSHIVDRGFKISLVVSMFKSPEQSWKDDTSNYRDFDNLVYINLNNSDYKEQIEYWYNTDKQLILWACVQSRKTLNLPIDINLLVYDEADHGYNKVMCNKLREATNCPVLYVTGTAYKMLWDFADSQRYIYSYYEEQLDKIRGLNNCPSMKVIVAKYQSDQYQAVFGDDPDAMKNLFNVDNEGNFIRPELVQDFVTNNFATQRMLRPEDRLLKNSTHLYITLPLIAACNAFEEYMKGTRFAPLVAHGKTKVKATDINKHIEENPNGSCIITVGANVRGVTAKKVDTIINCADGNSVEFWTQFAFRGGSGEHDWRVIDFCPQRCLESLRETYVAACDTSPEVAEYDFTDYVSITEWSDGFTELTSDQVNEILAADLGNAIRLMSSIVSTMNFDNLRNFSFNLRTKPADGNVVKRIQLNDNNANGKSNWVYEKNMLRSEKDEIYAKIDTIKAIAERIPLVLYHAINSQEVMNNIDSVINSTHYQPVTGDDENILQLALEHNVINREVFRKRISHVYVDVQHAINKDKRQTLAKLSESTQSQLDIPLELLDQMFEL
jgi:hypothetical protein